jgi:drug/metabolite transporter (DMT)-like permease
MFGAMVFYFLSIQTIGVAVSSALLGTQPLIIIFLALIFLKEKLSIQSISAVVLTLIGIFLLCDVQDFSFTMAKNGQLLAIGSAALLSLNFVYQKKILSHIPSNKLVFYQSFFQLPLLIPFLITEPPQLSVNFMLAAILLGVFCTVLAYGLIYNGVSSVSAQKIGVLQSIEYIMPMALGVLFYQEKLSMYDCIGAVLIIVSTIVINLKPVLKVRQSI